MPQFYHSIVTEKSFQLLLELKKNYKFILIGGWAVFFYTNALKSKDIDLIAGYDELGKLKEKFVVHKNERLKKYEIKLDEFDIDIYLPHYSDLGVDIRGVEETATAREGFILPKLEILFMLKLYAWQSRRGSIKGQKDELDIFSLAFLKEFDWKDYLGLVEKFRFGEYNQTFIALLESVKNIDELGLNNQKLSHFRKKILGLII